jgi:YaiO family outer membrane protein
MFRTFSLLLGLLLVASASVPQPSFAQTSKSVSPADLRLETLRPENASRDWRTLYLLSPAAVTPDEGSAYGYTGPANLFGLHQTEQVSGLYRPLSQRLGSLVETNYATGSSGISERSLLGQVGTRLAGGWGLQAGVRHSEMSFAGNDWSPYQGTFARADLGMLTFERHWDQYRGAYTVFGTLGDNGALATAQRLQIDWFYSERSSIGVAYTTGRELELAPNLLSLAPVDVNNIGLVGEHWVTPAWAIHYRALLEERGLQGLQPQIQFGIRSRF